VLLDRGYVAARYTSSQKYRVYELLDPSVANVAPDRAISVDAGRGRADVPGNAPVASTVDMQEPRPEAPPDGLDAAAARVGTSEDIRALAEQFGVDAKTGEFSELDDIAAMRDAGRLTPEDIKMLDDAEAAYKDAEAWSDVLRAATACVMN
jgi:hypothetical protein